MVLVKNRFDHCIYFPSLGFSVFPNFLVHTDDVKYSKVALTLHDLQSSLAAYTAAKTRAHTKHTGNVGSPLSELMLQCLKRVHAPNGSGSTNIRCSPILLVGAVDTQFGRRNNLDIRTRDVRNILFNRLVVNLRKMSKAVSLFIGLRILRLLLLAKQLGTLS